MADVQGLLSDPKFNALSVAGQKAALGGIDSRFASLSDEGYQNFRSAMQPKDLGSQQLAKQGLTAAPPGQRPSPAAASKSIEDQSLTAPERAVNNAFPQITGSIQRGGDRLQEAGNRLFGHDEPAGGRYKAASDAIRGTGEMMAPIGGAATIANPVAGLRAAAAGYVAGNGVENGLNAFGVDPGKSALAGDVAGIAAGGKMAESGPSLPRVARTVRAVGSGIKAAAPEVAGGAAMIGAGEVLSQIPGMSVPARIGLDLPGTRMLYKGARKGIKAFNDYGNPVEPPATPAAKAAKSVRPPALQGSSVARADAAAAAEAGTPNGVAPPPIQGHNVAGPEPPAASPSVPPPALQGSSATRMAPAVRPATAPPPLQGSSLPPEPQEQPAVPAPQLQGSSLSRVPPPAQTRTVSPPPLQGNSASRYASNDIGPQSSQSSQVTPPQSSQSSPASVPPVLGSTTNGHGPVAKMSKVFQPDEGEIARANAAKAATSAEFETKAQTAWANTLGKELKSYGFSPEDVQQMKPQAIDQLTQSLGLTPFSKASPDKLQMLYSSMR